MVQLQSEFLKQPNLLPDVCLKARLDPNLHDIYQRSIMSAPSRVVSGIWITAELESEVFEASGTSL